MILAARGLAGIVAAILLFLGLRYTFAPESAQSLLALTPDNAFGLSNIRAMAAPMIMLGIITAIGAIKSAHEYLTPAPVYFLVLIVIRIVSLVSEGTDTSVIRSLVLAGVFFVVTEFAVQVVKRANKADAVA